MSLRELRSLIAIARHGSFAAASEAVGLTPSAISLHVKKLEDEFGAELFDRTKRRLTITAAGRTAVARAGEIVACYDRMAMEIAGGAGFAGKLKLGSIQSAVAGPLPSVLSRMHHEHPKLRVTVTVGMSAELAHKIEDGDLDAAITSEPPRRSHASDMLFSPLYSDRLWVVAPEGSKGGALELLRKHPLLRFDRRAWVGQLVEDELQALGVHVEELMELDSQDALARMAADGLGVAIVPLADRDLARLPPLTRRPFGDPQRVRRIGLLERTGSPWPRLAQTLGRCFEGLAP